MKKHAKPDGIGSGSRHFLRAALVVAAFMLVSLSICSPSVSAGDWRHFGFDEQYTSFNPLEKTINIDNVGTLERKWDISLCGSLAIFRGKLFISAGALGLRAYNARTGKNLWRFAYGSEFGPVVSLDGTVFYLQDTNPTHLYAVNGTTGQKIWKAPKGFPLGFNDTSLITVDEQRNLLYLVTHEGGGYGKLFAIDKNAGEVAWCMSKATNGVWFSGDYVLLNTGKIYAMAGGFVRIDPSTQAIEIQYDEPDEGFYRFGQYTICNDKLVVGVTEYYDRDWSAVAAYNIDSPHVLWKKRIPPITGQIACNRTKNIVYIPTDPYLYAVDATTGELIWRYMGYGSIYTPSIANGIVYFVSDTNMYALNESTGQKIFRYPLGNRASETTQVAVSNGMLFFSINGIGCDLFVLGLPSQDLSVVTFKVVDSSASETGPDVGKLRVCRTGIVTAPLSVSYSVSGSATNGVDYTKLSGKVTIQAGSTAASIAIKPVDDVMTEDTETVKLDLLEDPSYQIGSPGSAVISILDNEW